MYDWLIVGAGFAGSVLAERLASQRREKVLIVDRRSHIGGNAYDCYNDDGILYHRYGPHIFHTNADQIVEHLSQFTAWRPYEHRVLGEVDGKLVPIPINLDTINTLFGLSLGEHEVEAFLAARAEKVETIRTSRTWSCRGSGASSTRSSSRATRASNGAWTLPSSTSR